MSSKDSESKDNCLEEAGGSENMRNKRIRDLVETEKNHKKVKTSVDAVAQEYTCSITHELMLDPVMARDGHLYEREAIEETIRVQGNALKSPKTGLKMKPELLPAVSVKNTIEALVESGAIDGDLADHYKQGKLVLETKKEAIEGDIDAMQSLGNWYQEGSKGLPEDKELAKKWLKKASDAALVRDTTAKAEAGDAEAMYRLAIWHRLGKCGLSESNEMAAPWFEKAAELKYAPAMAVYALNVAAGRGGVEKNVSYGVVLTLEAAMAGSDVACANLGTAYLYGKYGLPKKLKEARRWLTKATDGSCSFKHATIEGLEKARRNLERVISEFESQSD